MHTLLGVVELLVIILEQEAKMYDKFARSTHQGRSEVGVENPSSCASKYMNLERYYIMQN